MRFSLGDTIVRRYTLLDGRVGAVQAVRVVSDDDRGLLTWTNHGYATAHRTPMEDESHYLSCNDKLWEPTRHVPGSWRSNGVLMFSVPEAAHSVWWFFDEHGDFERWYVNLETPGKRWAGGRDCVDQALDVWIDRDGGWEWKDEEEFVGYTGSPGYWDADQAVEIRAEGERVVKRAQAGEFPFDGTWCDFVPDPAWGPTRLPWWWDQVPDQCDAAYPPIHARATVSLVDDLVSGHFAGD